LSIANMLRCPSCGNEEPEGARFCGSCGATLALAEAEPAETVHCPSCGNEEPEGARFCGSCGAPFAPSEPEPAGTESAEASTPPEVIASAIADAPTDVAPPPDWPQAPPPEPAPPPPPRAAVPDRPSAAQPPAATPTRRKRLLPAIAAIALIAAGVVVAVIVFSGGGGSSNFTRKANELIAPVTASNRLLSVKLRSARLSNLGDVAGAAAQLTRDLTQAEGALMMLEVRGDDRQAKALLAQALTANLGYGEKVEAAADGLDELRASAAATAGRQAAQSYSAAGSAAPKLVLPQTAIFQSASQLQSLAADQAEQAHARAALIAAISSYVRSIDGLLRNSARTRASLATLIASVRGDRVSASQATAQIASIISQRQGLQTQVASVPTPTEFRNAAVRLRNSIRASLDDDYAIQEWISARFAGNSSAVKRAFARHDAATARASAAKADFLVLYNRLRSRFLKLPPIRVSY
jgi:hypothetical protein